MDIRVPLWAEAVLVAALFVIPAVGGLAANGDGVHRQPRADAPSAPEIASPAAPAEAERRQPSERELQRRDDQKRLRAAARVDEERIRNADAEPQNWLAHGRTYGEERFSPLTGITAANVSQLGAAWEYETGTNRGLSATPIVVDGVMFATGSWSIVYALDAKTGRQLWRFDPEVPGERGRYACCDVVNRGVAVWEGKVYVATIDGRLIALDADTGRPVWDVVTIDRAKPYTITHAPRIVKGMVIVGNGGSELGVRGYITAYDAKTGRELWRFYTVPGNPNLPQDGPHLEKALQTWPTGDGAPRWWEMGGGGTAWDSFAYDPELDLLYAGVGNGSPWSRWMRSGGEGDNLYVASILALRPETGELVWHYQTTPGDTWDYTATQHMILADLTIGGTPRKVLMQAPKNGFFYVLDRATGELISAEPYTLVNWASGIDKATGRPIENKDLLYGGITDPKVIVPSQFGGHNWQPMAFNPQTGLVYIPVIEAGAIYVAKPDAQFQPKVWNTGTDFAAVTRVLLSLPPEELAASAPRGAVKAWNPVTQQQVWAQPMTGPWNGGLLTTAGNLVFGGAADGIFRAWKADTGEEVWSIDLKTGIIAPPITYSVDGEQYVAVLAGFGGAGGIASIKDPASAVAKHGTNQGRVFAFKVGAPKKDVAVLGTPRGPMTVAPPPVTGDIATVDQGFEHFHRYCMVCHGYFGESVGVLPDLRMSSPEVWGQYEAIVRGGALKANGMASFADVLDAGEVEAIRQYLLAQANVLWSAQQGAANPAPAQR